MYGSMYGMQFFIRGLNKGEIIWRTDSFGAVVSCFLFVSLFSVYVVCVSSFLSAFVFYLFNWHFECNNIACDGLN